jgi:hypothetical protein
MSKKKEKWVVDFSALSYTKSKKEAERLMDQLMAAAEALCCGKKKRKHTCRNGWTCGGSTSTKKSFDERETRRGASCDIRPASDG